MLWLLSPIGGILYRARGGWPDIPRPIEQCLFCLPVLLFVIYVPWYTAICAYALSVVATLKGHGKHMDLGSYDKPADDEWYEFLIKWLENKIPVYWYDVIGISLSGLFITLPLILVTTNAFVILAGSLKGLAYMIGWSCKLPSVELGKFTISAPTEWGEFLTGLFIWAVILGV